MKRIYRFWPWFLIISLMSGCAYLRNLEELLTLNEYSQNKDAQAREVSRQEEQFQALLKAAESGELLSFVQLMALNSEKQSETLPALAARPGTATMSLVKKRSMKAVSSQKDILAAFGPPVLIKSVPDQPSETLWLYRSALKKVNSELVYLYFDPQGALLRYRHSQP